MAAFGTAPLAGAALLWLCAAAAAQLPPPPAPPQNPVTPAKVLLGKALFWDEQLSSDDSVACGTCHHPEAGGADPRAGDSPHPGHDGQWGTADDVSGSAGLVRQDPAGDYALDPRFGFGARVTRRTAPTNLGSAYHAQLFWDGRADSAFDDPETGLPLMPYGAALERQAIAPILDDVEMAQSGRTWSDVRQKLQRVVPLKLAAQLTPDLAGALQGGVGYPALFAAAFGDPAITAARIASALASYQRTLIPDQTPFDRYAAGDGAALTPSQVQGLNLFQGAARCAICHPAPLFTDDQFHSLGLRPSLEDRGRGAVTGSAADDGAFRTRTLRNAGLRPRLFHNGQSPALGDAAQLSDPASVANVYLNGGGADLSNLDPALLPLLPGLGVADMALVLDFVQNGLTDPRAAQGLPPFDHPLLRSSTQPQPRRFGAALPGTSEPGFVATAPTWIGNAAWKLGLHGGDGGTVAALFFSPTALVPAAIYSGIPVHVAEPSSWLPFTLHGPAGAPGAATWHLSIPADPALTGLTLYFQLFVLDGGAPLGMAASQGLELVAR
jgi:cytochrome c peroxidase